VRLLLGALDAVPLPPSGLGYFNVRVLGRPQIVRNGAGRVEEVRVLDKRFDDFRPFQQGKNSRDALPVRAGPVLDGAKPHEFVEVHALLEGVEGVRRV
jgi:hypothetical protein